MVKLKIEHSLNHSIKIVLLVFFTLFNSTCSPDDDDEEPPRDYFEQSLEDDQQLVQYLKSHYYNYQDFTNVVDEDKEILIDTIASENPNLKSLFDFAVETSIPLAFQILDFEACALAAIALELDRIPALVCEWSTDSVLVWSETRNATKVRQLAKLTFPDSSRRFQLKETKRLECTAPLLIAGPG